MKSKDKPTQFYFIGSNPVSFHFIGSNLVAFYFIQSNTVSFHFIESNLKTLRNSVVGKHGESVDVVELAGPIPLEQSPQVGHQDLEQIKVN
jgi:hypothetical protein